MCKHSHIHTCFTEGNKENVNLECCSSLSCRTDGMQLTFPNPMAWSHVWKY